jgi:hypothetical protein
VAARNSCCKQPRNTISSQMPAETESRKQLQGHVAGWIRLARLGKLHYAGKVASGGSHLTPLSVDPVAIQISV